MMVPILLVILVLLVGWGVYVAAAHCPETR